MSDKSIRLIYRRYGNTRLFLMAPKENEWTPDPLQAHQFPDWDAAFAIVKKADTNVQPVEGIGSLDTALFIHLTKWNV